MNEGLKEFEAVSIGFKHILRMPLDAPDKAFPGHPGGFDEAVGGNGHHFQAGGQVLDGLVMEGVDGDFDFAKEFLDGAREADRMGGLIVRFPLPMN